MKKVNLDLIAYKLLVFLFIPVSWLWALIYYFVSTDYDKHISLYLVVFLIVCNYFTYIKNRFFYWIGYVLILTPTFLIYASSRMTFGEMYTTLNTQSSIVVNYKGGQDVTGIGKQIAEKFNKNVRTRVQEWAAHNVRISPEMLLDNYETVRNNYANWLNQNGYTSDQQKQIMAEFDSVAIHPYSIKGFVLSLFGSYENFKTFVDISGVVSFLVYFYFWTGVGYLFKSYNNITISGGVSWRMKLSIPDFIKNPIVIGALIISLSGIIMVAYYRYTDPYNHCLREFKKQNTKASDLSAMQRCNKLIYNK